MAREFDPYKLSSPRIFLLRMVIFLIIAAFVPLVLYREVATAFMNNPGLNGLIVGVLVIGIAMAVRNVIALMPEVRWVNSFRRRETAFDQSPPRLLAPMATLLRDRAESLALSTSTWRSLLDSISTRVDENREILRYLAGLPFPFEVLSPYAVRDEVAAHARRLLAYADVAPPGPPRR